MRWTALNSKPYNALKILASRLRRLKFSQQWKDAAGKAKKLLGFINRNIYFNNRHNTLYQLSQTPSGICRAIMVASPCKGYSKTRSCPAKDYEDDNVFGNKSYEERLAWLEKRRLRDKIIVFFLILKGFTNMNASKLFWIDNTSLTMSNGAKLRCKQVQLDCTNSSLLMTWLVSGITFHVKWCSVALSILLKTNLTTISPNKVSDKSKAPGVLQTVSLHTIDWISLLQTALTHTHCLQIKLP